jgi:hypothetical protein
MRGRAQGKPLAGTCGPMLQMPQMPRGVVLPFPDSLSNIRVTSNSGGKPAFASQNNQEQVRGVWYSESHPSPVRGLKEKKSKMEKGLGPRQSQPQMPQAVAKDHGECRNQLTCQRQTTERPFHNCNRAAAGLLTRPLRQCCSPASYP